MPPGDYQRFSSIHLLSERSAGRANEFFEQVCTAIRASFAGSLPILTTLPVFSRDWILSVAVLVALQVFLWWALLVPLRQAPSPLKKFVKILVMTGVTFDAAVAVWWLNFHAPRPFRISSGVGVALELLILVVWWVLFFGIIFSRLKYRSQFADASTPRQRQSSVDGPTAAPELRVPKVRFADVGGMEEVKQQIREVVESRLYPQKYAAYGVDRNGVLLYGPRGSGKTFIAEATAGEFSLNYYYVSPTRFITMWTGETEASIRNAFMRARANRPALLFIDEVDALGSVRQNLSVGGDPGGAGRSYNNMAIELMQSIDEARSEPGLVIMAATNVIEGLDEALIREGRFDVKIRVDLPDEATREKIFKTQLSTKPWEGFALTDFAKRTPGASAAKIRSLVDQAAIFAAREGRRIEARDLQRALEEYGGKERPLFQPVEWEDVVVGERVEQELRSLVRVASNPFTAQRMRLQVPMGLLLLGPPGTGKTMIARLIATQSKRSFLPITSAEITDPKGVSRVFARARENSPSLIFMDEIDSLVPANPGNLNQYYVQIVEQFLIEISALQPEHNVFLVGTANRPENIDPRILRGGRFSEKIEIGLPGRKEVGRLFAKYLASIELAPTVGLDYLTEWFTGTTPADLEAVVATAKRYAFERSGDDRIAPLTLDDFRRAACRVKGQSPSPPSVRSTHI